MSKLVEKFLEEHDSDAAFQDEQFRRQVAQKLWKLDSHVEDLIDFWKSIPAAVIRPNVHSCGRSSS